LCSIQSDEPLVMIVIGVESEPQLGQTESELEIVAWVQVERGSSIIPKRPSKYLLGDGLILGELSWPYGV
jgi:hypothetical protein